MPGRRQAPVKRPRAQKTGRRAEPFPLLRIEQPLTDAINFTQALYLMGFGLISHHEAGGDAIVALARETGKRLKPVVANDDLTFYIHFLATPPAVILRACESIDFCILRHGSNQRLRTRRNVEIRIDSQTLRSRALARRLEG
jgi:hypothetical protein